MQFSARRHFDYICHDLYTCFEVTRMAILLLFFGPTVRLFVRAEGEADR